MCIACSKTGTQVNLLAKSIINQHEYHIQLYQLKETNKLLEVGDTFFFRQHQRQRRVVLALHKKKRGVGSLRYFPTHSRKWHENWSTFDWQRLTDFKKAENITQISKRPFLGNIGVLHSSVYICLIKHYNSVQNIKIINKINLLIIIIKQLFII